ncbi:hypothetical protein [Nocardia higoensis]|uniref:hypothetical protein n=1 Tax=Nocardia higoensis TaxID=228599 RepID=UPI000687D4D3|nr:hypothetical protein [Nocardia higoensis]
MSHEAHSVRADDLTREVCRILAETAPDGWERLDLLFLTVGDTVEQWFNGAWPGGDIRAIESIPTALGETLKEMRRIMYRPGAGTWFQLRLYLDADMTHTAVYDYDNDPRFEVGIDPAEWVRDLQEFPREERHVPLWLRQLLGIQTAGDRADQMFNAPAGPEAQGQILELIATRILAVGPPCWQELRLRYSKIGDNDYGGCRGFLFYHGATLPYTWNAPDEISQLFAYLKHAMSHPDRGTWLSVDYTLTFPSHYSVGYVRGTEPLEPPAAAADLRREFELYPRTPEYTPEWMTDLLR